MFAAERELKQERMQAYEAMKPALDKLGRGERLTVEERTAMNQGNERVSAIEAELRDYEAARAASAAVQTPEAPELTGDEARERAFSDYLAGRVEGRELRAQGVATNSDGGYLVPPGFLARLTVAMKAFGGTSNDFEQLETGTGQPLQWATVDPTTTEGQQVGSTTTTGANSDTPGSGDAGTDNENQAVGDLDYVFGQGTLSAYMYTSGIQRISFQLEDDSAFSMDGFVRARVGEALGRALARDAIAGSGSSAPLGIKTALNAKGSAGTVDSTIAATGGFVTLATAKGVPMTASGTETELTANTLSPSTLRYMIAAVDPAYIDLGASFYVNAIQLLGMRGQVDSNGRPLINIQDGISQGEPSSLWGYPVKVDQKIPNLAASTTGGPIFGHLATAMVLRRVQGIGVLRLVERYAENLQVGYIGYMRWDSRSNDLRAAVTVKPASS